MRRSIWSAMTSRGVTLGGVIAVAAVAGLARAALLMITVDGESMAPSYRPGDSVLVARRWITGRIRPGDVVVCRLPAGLPGPAGYLVKRVTSVSAGQVFLQGDGDHSYDSRAFGWIPVRSVVGRVITRLTRTS